EPRGPADDRDHVPHGGQRRHSAGEPGGKRTERPREHRARRDGPGRREGRRGSWVRRGRDLRIWRSVRREPYRSADTDPDQYRKAADEEPADHRFAPTRIESATRSNVARSNAGLVSDRYAPPSIHSRRCVSGDHRPAIPRTRTASSETLCGGGSLEPDDWYRRIPIPSSSAAGRRYTTVSAWTRGVCTACAGDG